MRFIPVNAIRPGMVNAVPLYGSNQEVLLREGIPLTESIIRHILLLGYNGIYVDYDPDSDKAYAGAIDAQLRIEAVRRIKKTFLSMEQGPSPQEAQRLKQALSATLEQLLDELLQNRHLMINMIDLKVFDDYTYYHSVNVTVIALALGVCLDLPRPQLYKLGLASLLHDIGKIMIPRALLDKLGSLTPEEFDIMKGHSEEGYRYLKDIYDVPVSVYMAVRLHHEQFEGGGYPLGLRSGKIPLFSRLIAVADVFDALTSDRVYRKALSPSDAAEYVMAQSGVMFDPLIVRAFQKKVAPYPVGSAVRLSDSRVGIVAENMEDFGLRPVVRIVKHETLLEAPYLLDLKDMDTMNVTVLGLYQDTDLTEIPVL